MEIILAFIATLLAIIFGFLFVRTLFSGGSKTSAKSTVNFSEVVKQEMAAKFCSDVPKIPSTNSIYSSYKCGSNKVEAKNEQNFGDKALDERPQDDEGSFLIDSQDLELLSTSNGSVKEFVRNLRENQLEEMTEEEIEQENRIKKEQLEEIFQLMQSSQNQCGMDSFDDMEEQMKLYAITK